MVQAAHAHRDVLTAASGDIPPVNECEGRIDAKPVTAAGPYADEDSAEEEEFADQEPGDELLERSGCKSSSGESPLPCTATAA